MLINKKTLEYLAELSRIKIEGRKEEKLLKDLLEILNYFEELKESNTENIEPTRPPEFAQAKSGAVTGGTNLENVFREDDPSQINADQTRLPAAGRDKRGLNISVNQRCNQRKSALIKDFPEKENGFLKIPPVFE